jgi:enamine deaminase RidA (YjgF/YER057c/UK114 family)
MGLEISFAAGGVMPNIIAQLQRMGMALPSVPMPQGAYVPAVRSGRLIFVAGQLPMHNGQLLCTGRVGETVTLEQAQEAARWCFLNALAAACSVGVQPEQLTRVLQITGFVQGTANFYAQPKVLNAASELAQELFGEAGRHARAAVGVLALPLNAPVELTATFEVAD